MSQTRTITDPRSVLFMHADKSAVAAKIRDIRTDVAVLDIEDTIPHDAKTRARHQVCTTLTLTDLLDEDVPILVRGNETDSPWIADDLSLAQAIPRVGVVLPKAGSLQTVEQIRPLLADLHPLVGLESGGWVANAQESLTAGRDGCYFDAEDYIVFSPSGGGIRRACGAGGRRQRRRRDDGRSDACAPGPRRTRQGRSRLVTSAGGRCSAVEWDAHR